VSAGGIQKWEVFWDGDGVGGGGEFGSRIGEGTKEKNPWLIGWVKMHSPMDERKKVESVKGKKASGGSKKREGMEGCF